MCVSIVYSDTIKSEIFHFSDVSLYLTSVTGIVVAGLLKTYFDVAGVCYI